MKKKEFRYIYGPVPSWRLGSSLGIDLLSQDKKLCTFDCTYCQIGRTLDYTKGRKVYVPTEEVVKEIESLPEVWIDYITFSGRGEPTLAENFGDAIKAVKEVRKEKIAVLTNSSLIGEERIREELSLADFVCLKLDACDEETLKRINKPQGEIRFEPLLRGIMQFRKEYHGRLALQIMFLEENRRKAGRLADLAREVMPDEVQINTPLRPCGAKPLSESEVIKIKRDFEGLNVVSVYEAGHKEVTPLSSEDTLRRRGKIQP